MTKKILREIGFFEPLKKNNPTNNLICRVYTRRIAVGDKFNAIYRLQVFQVGEEEETEFRYKIEDFRRIDLELIKINFCQKDVSEVYRMQNAVFTFSGEVGELSKNDVIAYVEE